MPGIAAGSLVCYLVGISDVDAVRHDLAFERFMNPMRDELPDIDIDVESARREDVYDMVLSRHGDDRAGCVAMIDTYRARASVREVGKALGLPELELGQIATSFPHISARHLRDAIDRLPELEGVNLKAEQLELLFRVAERLDGFRMPRMSSLRWPRISTSSLSAWTIRKPLERNAPAEPVRPDRGPDSTMPDGCSAMWRGKPSNRSATRNSSSSGRASGSCLRARAAGPWPRAGAWP